MKRILSSSIAAIILLLLSLFAAAAAWALEPAYSGDNKAKARVDVLVSGGNLVYEGTNSYRYQSDGAFEIQVNAAPAPGSPGALIPASVVDPRVAESESSIDAAYLSASGRYDLFEQVNDQQAQASLELPAMGDDPVNAMTWWRIHGLVSTSVTYAGEDAEGNPVSGTVYEETAFDIEVSFIRRTKYDWWCDGETAVAKAWTIYVDGGNISYAIPMEGATVRPSSDGMSFRPAMSTTTINPNYGNGDEAVAIFECVTPLESYFDAMTGGSARSAEVAGATVSLAINDIQLPDKEVPYFFAEVVKYYGTVEAADPVTLQYVPVTNGMRLAPGSRLRGFKEVTPQTTLYPEVRIRFCNGVVETIGLIDQGGQNLIALLGRSGVDSVGKRLSRVELMLKELSYMTQYNPRELASRVVSKAFGYLAGGLSGGSSFIVGESTEVFVQEYIDHSRRSSLREQNPRLSPHIDPPGEEPAPGSNYTWRLFEDGTFVFENPGPTLSASFSDGRFYLIPTGTSRKFYNDDWAEPEPPEQLPAPNPYDNSLTLSPVSGDTVSRTPTITMEPRYDLRKGSVACWLNGVNITPFMQQSPPYNSYPKTVEASFSVPPEMRLPEGENTLECRGVDDWGTTFRAVSTFIATGAPEQPQGLMAIPGSSAIVLRWQAGREHDLAGYNVYRATDAAGPFQFLGQPTQPVYADQTVEDEVHWYAVSAVDEDGVESALSILSSQATGGDARPAATSPAFSMTPRNRAIELDIERPGADTACWKLERSINGGAFEPLLDGLGLVADLKYIDDDVVDGWTYSYRLTAMNADLQGGAQTESAPAQTLDTPPAPPFGVTVDLLNGQALLRWNDSPDTAEGYRIHVNTDNGGFVANPDLVTGSQARLPVQADKVYLYALSAVDDLGREGPMSVYAELSTWDLQRAANASFLLLLLDDDR